MIYLITTIHVIVCFFLIIVVLLQSGKSGDIAAAFGGMGSQTAFGPRGAATALVQGDHLVNHHLYDHLDHALGYGLARGQRYELRPAGDHAVANQDAAGYARASSGATGTEVVVGRWPWSLAKANCDR